MKNTVKITALLVVIGFSMAMAFAALSLTGCSETDPGNDGGGGISLKVLAGDVTISPSTGVTTGTELTAVYSGTESVTYQWNKDGEAIEGAGGAKRKAQPMSAPTPVSC